MTPFLTAVETAHPAGNRGELYFMPCPVASFLGAMLRTCPAYDVVELGLDFVEAG